MTRYVTARELANDRLDYNYTANTRNGEENRTLTWIRYNREESGKYGRLKAILSAWSGDKGINYYITNRDLSTFLDEMLDMCSDNTEYLYFALENDELIGVVYIMGASDCRDSACIDYLVVNPDKRGCKIVKTPNDETKIGGYATLMIKSVVDNVRWFTFGNFKKDLCASIENTNMASMKVFRNCEFRKDYEFGDFVHYKTSATEEKEVL